MKNLSYLFVLSILLFNCSSEDDGNAPNNTTPGPFSVTILETRMDGASIEWTEAIDIDGDAITYSIYLNDALISTGGTSLSYNFTGLDPETLYDGYIIASDGKGGTSRADFFFETEPEIVRITVNAADWIYDSFPEAGGTRELRGAGYEVPFYADAVSYQLEIIAYTMVLDGVTYNVTGTYTWTNSSQNSPVSIGDAGQYRVTLAGLSINTISSNYDESVAYMESRAGTAEVIIIY
jgi:hypothetical protein